MPRVGQLGDQLLQDVAVAFLRPAEAPQRLAVQLLEAPHQLRLRVDPAPVLLDDLAARPVPADVEWIPPPRLAVDALVALRLPQVDDSALAGRILLGLGDRPRNPIVRPPRILLLLLLVRALLGGRHLRQSELGQPPFGELLQRDPASGLHRDFESLLVFGDVGAEPLDPDGRQVFRAGGCEEVGGHQGAARLPPVEQLDEVRPDGDERGDVEFDVMEDEQVRRADELPDLGDVGGDDFGKARLRIDVPRPAGLVAFIGACGDDERTAAVAYIESGDLRVKRQNHRGPLPP